MTLAEKTRFITKMLDELYPDPPIPLRHKNSFTLLVAVVLSARCTDKQVNKTTPALFSRADTPEAMSRLGVEAIREVIRPCGLSPQKAKAIQALSAIIVREHNGNVPDTFCELEALPGVGHKTASVVMCQAFGKPAFPVDTHIHRLAKRWGLSSGRSVVQTERDLKKAFPMSQWNKLHLQMIYYGRSHSPAQGFDIEKSPICRRLMVAEQGAHS